MLQKGSLFARGVCKGPLSFTNRVCNRSFPLFTQRFIIYGLGTDYVLMTVVVVAAATLN